MIVIWIGLIWQKRGRASLMIKTTVIKDRFSQYLSQKIEYVKDFQYCKKDEQKFEFAF